MTILNTAPAIVRPLLAEVLDSAALDAEIAAANVTRRAHPTLPLSIYTYGRACQYENHWTPITMRCRGLIVDDSADRIVLLSGRGEEVRPHTERWLKANGVHYDELWMRAAKDQRGDDIVKGELFDAHIRHRYAARVILDDRDRVVALWRRIGLACWQVNYGDF